MADYQERWRMSLNSLGLGIKFQQGRRELFSINRHKLHYFLEIIFYLKFKTILLHTANCAL